MQRGLLHSPHRGVHCSSSSRWSFGAPWQQRSSLSSFACRTAMLDSPVTTTADSRGTVAQAPTLPCPILDQAPVHPDGLSSHEVLTSAAAQMAANSCSLTHEVSDEAPTAPTPYVPAFKQGDVVYATVVHTGPKGATAEIMYHQGLVGFMPKHQTPITPEQWASGHGRGRRQWSEQGDMLHAHGAALPGTSPLVKGHTRPFKVQNIPSDMRPGVKGPLLSAYRYDQDMLWSRVAQLHQLAQEDADFMLLVKVTGYDSRFLITSLCGLQAIIPRDQVLLRPHLNWKQAAEQLVGQEVEVCLLTDRFNAANGTIVLSESMAAWKRLTRPGTVLSGTIRMFTNYGAFVRVDGLGCQALLHNSRVTSDEIISSAQEVFCMDERITFMMLGTSEDDQSRLAISTQALELEYGEIAVAKDYVFARAAEGPSMMRLPDEGRKRRNTTAAHQTLSNTAVPQSQRQLSDMLTKIVRTYGNHVETAASRAADKQRAGKDARQQQYTDRRSPRTQRAPGAAAEEVSNEAQSAAVSSEVQSAAVASEGEAAAIISEAQAAAVQDHLPGLAVAAELVSPIRNTETDTCPAVDQPQGEHAATVAAVGRRIQASYWQQWLE